MFTLVSHTLEAEQNELQYDHVRFISIHSHHLENDERKQQTDEQDETG